MKKILIAVSFLVMSIPAFADGKILARLSHFSNTIESITIKEDGKAKIALRANPISLYRPLSSDELREIMDLAPSLSKSEITVDHRRIICHIISPSYLDEVLEVAGPDQSDLELKTLLTPNGCQYSTYTHPKSEEDLKRAHQLRDLLKKWSAETWASVITQPPGLVIPNS